MDQESQPASTSSTWLANLKSGDPRAWDVLVHQYRPMFLGVLARFGLSGPDAEDVVQEALYRVHVGLERFQRRRRGSFRSWLSKILQRTALGQLGKKSRADRFATNREGYIADAAATERGDIADILASQELDGIRLQLQQHVEQRVRDRMIERSWQAYKLFYGEKLPIKVIANRLGMSVLAVSQSHTRARKMFAQEFLAVLGETYPRLLGILREENE